MVEHLHFYRQISALGTSSKGKLDERLQKLRKALRIKNQQWETESISLNPSRDFKNQPPENLSESSFPENYLKYLQATIEENQHFVVIIDSNYRCIAINRKARKESLRILGFSIKAGMSIRDERISKYPELDRLMKLWGNALAGESSMSEASFAGVNEEASYYRLNYYPIHNDQGEVIAAVQAGHDITAEKKALQEQQQLQNALQLSNSKLQGIIKGAKYAIAAVNSDLELIELNQEAKKLLSHFCHRPFILGDSLASFVEDASFLSLWQRAVSGQEFTRLQKLKHEGTSETKHYEISFSSILDETGKLIGASMMARDVSRERQIEQELKDIKEFRFLAENVPQLIWITRANGEPEFYNERFFRFTGMSLSQLKNEQWRNLIHPDDLEEGMRTWNKALHTGEACEMEYRLKRFSDQSYRWHLVRSVPMKNRQGEVTHWIGSATDIHERKLQTEQIAEKNRQLSRINKYMDDFVHTTAHDMRVPVARLQLLTDTFQDLPPDERESLLPKISRSVRHLDSTLRGLIQVIELQDGQEKIEERISLKEVIEHIMDRNQEAIREANAVIRIHDDGQCEVCYIKRYLYTIIGNMVSNALKYRDTNRRLQLDISIQKAQGFCRLTFRDNGIGINLEQYQRQLFQPFRRINSHIEGLGLGLYVTHTMLEKNGGRVEVDSRPGEGSVFDIYLKEYEMSA